MSRYVAMVNCLLTRAIATFGDNELLDFLQCPVLAVAQRHRDVAERVLEIVRGKHWTNRVSQNLV